MSGVDMSIDEVDETVPSVMMNTLRTYIAKVDWVAFILLKLCFEVFFNVATAEIFSNATIRSFYGRIQLILGVFMVFRLSITVIGTIIDPEKMNDKNEGFAAVIKRVVIGLLLLAALTPINIPDAANGNEFERELNNNGLIFGTLYSLQRRVLANNTIGRIVLGTTDLNTNEAADPDSTNQTDAMGESLSSMANVFTATIIRIFVRINLRDEAQRAGTDKADITDPGNWMCPITNDVLDAYTQVDASPSLLLGEAMLTTTCAEGFVGTLIKSILNTNMFNSGNARYAFVYIPIIGGVCAIIIAVVLIGFSVDIAIRALKLSVLRLIAPIPIIAYMGPQSKDNTAFSNWIKAVISTYVDLFIRLAIIFFVLFLVQDIIVNGITITHGTGIVGAFSMLFIIIGIFIFARLAPRYIQEVLGIKQLGSNIGLATIMGGLGSARGGIQGIGMGMMNSYREQVDTQAQGKQAPGVMDSWRQSSDNMAKIRTGDKDAHGGLMGYLQDRLNYQARDHAADRLGMGADDMARAKYSMDRAQAEADYAQANLDRVSARYQRGDATYEELRTAQEQNQEAQGRAASAKKKYDKIDKGRGQLGASPRVYDTVRNTYRSGQSVETHRRFYEYNDATGRWEPVNNVNRDNDRTFMNDYNQRVRNNPDQYRVVDGATDRHGNFIDDDTNIHGAHIRRDASAYDGTVDDRMITLPTNGPGPGPGGPGPGGPGHP